MDLWYGNTVIHKHETFIVKHTVSWLSLKKFINNFCGIFMKSKGMNLIIYLLRKSLPNFKSFYWSFHA